jgi:DNA-directed RNA polymerase specialized sigma24 family protein
MSTLTMDDSGVQCIWSVSLAAIVPTSSSKAFDDAAKRVVTALRTGAATAESARDLDTILQWLQHWAATTLRVPDADAADAAQDAVLALLERATLGASGEEVRNPAAFLTWLARNRAIDRLRAQARRAPEPLESITAHVPAEDDSVARLLDRIGGAAEVEAALAAAVRAGDALVVRVVTVWLNEAEAKGATPSSRAVAEKAGVSHTSVNSALRKFRTYFPSDPSGTSSP